MEEKSKSLLVRLIKDRINLFGGMYKSVAEKIGVHPVQLSKFLKEEEEGPLSREALEKLIKEIGIDLGCYEKRVELAAKVEQKLNKMDIRVSHLSKEHLISLTGFKEIAYFIEFKSEEERELFKDSGIIEKELSFDYFKTLVRLFEIIREKNKNEQEIRSSVTKKILPQIEDTTKVVGVAGFFLGMGILAPLGLAAAKWFFSNDDNNSK